MTQRMCKNPELRFRKKLLILFRPLGLPSKAGEERAHVNHVQSQD